MRSPNSTTTGTDGERAVSPIIGAVLLLGIAITALALYQVTTVPQQNHATEFEHNQQVQDELSELRVSIHETASANRHSSTSVKLGTEYQSRVLAINPPPARGSLETIEYGPDSPVTISNATDVDEDSNGFWNGGDRQYNSSAIIYEPSYAEYQTAPRTRYEHSLLYNRFDGEDTEVVVEDQRLIRGETVSLYTLVGDMGVQQSQRVTVDLEPNSASMQPVRVTDDGDPIQITIPTAHPDVWGDAIESDSVADVESHEENVTITLEQGSTYDLRLAQVGINEHERTSESYIVRDSSEQVLEGETFAAEVRDEFNNPVSGAPVEITEGDCTLPDERTTDRDGRIELVCDDAGTDSTTVELSIHDGNESWEWVDFTVVATEFEQPDPSPPNGGSPAESPFRYAELPDTIPGTGNDDIEFTIENTGPGTIEIDGFRVTTNSHPNSFTGYDIDTPFGEPNFEGDGDDVGTAIDHEVDGIFFTFETYSFEDGDEVVYTLEGFDDANMNNACFEFALITDAGDEYLVFDGEDSIVNC